MEYLPSQLGGDVAERKLVFALVAHQLENGRPLFIGAVTEGQWAKLCDVLGLDELKADPRLQTRPDQIKARDRTLPIIARAVARQDFAPLIAALERDGIPFSPIARPAEMYDDPHVNRPGGLLTSALPEGGSYRAPGLPFEVDGRPADPGAVDLPEIGRDTADILGALGFDEQEIGAASGGNRRHVA